ncbi:MAG: outer membrane beta-barrel domain-containing protein [Archangiaceae bacterium]|nr:outer membrane beta-barrel domain-containing protein [Archangiaceae bacterium]
MKHVFLAAALLVGPGAMAQVPFGQPDDEPTPGSNQAIQERAYRLTYEIAAVAGLMPVDPFTKQVHVGGAMALHFTDALGWQIRGGYAFSWASSLRQQLERDFNVTAGSFSPIQFFAGTQLLFKPFYGKSAVANRFVIHYEAYLELGATVFKYTNAFRPAIDVGGGLRVFQNRVLSYRLEVVDSIVLTGGLTNALSINLMLCINIGSNE